MTKHKVFVLDYDLISPLGIGKENVFTSIKENKRAGNIIKRFPVDGLPINVAAEVGPDLPKLYQSESAKVLEALKYDRKFELTVGCYHLMESRLKNLFSRVSPDRAGVILGVGLDVTPFEVIEPTLLKFCAEPDTAYIRAVDHLNRTRSLMNTVLNPLDLSSIYLSEKLRLGAFQKSTLTACSASTQAIALAYNSIITGEADIVLTGGTDSILNIMSYIAFGKLGVIQPNQGPVDMTCRPLDINRKGTLVGESAGLVVLANEVVTEQLKATPLLEILGFGNTLDGYKITSPHPLGIGMKRAMRTALTNSNLDPSEVDYINLHGTGTYANDPIELDSIIEVFGESAKDIPVSSLKDRHGHAIAAAGVQEFSILATCMENNLVPCTLNLERPIKNDEIDLVQGENRDKELNICLTNNFAFGGVNTVIAVGKVRN